MRAAGLTPSDQLASVNSASKSVSLKFNKTVLSKDSESVSSVCLPKSNLKGSFTSATP